MTTSNIVLILTDTQSRRMVGAYGEPAFETPRLDQLAAQGIRFNKAYCATPLSTPARCGLFSGLHPAVGGAWANEMTPARGVPLMGEVLQQSGVRAGYTGKWHLDGAGYHGDGQPGGGFEPDWWYDGKRYLDEIGEERHRALVKAITGGHGPKGGVTPQVGEAMRKHDAAAALRQLDCREEEVWGHRVADQAIDFLQTVGDDRFVLVVSFDEPHGPFVVPPRYAERYTVDDIPAPRNFAAPLDGKPALQQQQAQEFPVGAWKDFCAWRLRHVRCNAYIDEQIGRVIDAVDDLHADDTTIIYTADHGDMMGSHGLLSKGAMMYEQCTGVPLIVRTPDGLRGDVCDRPVSHLDLMPTMLEQVGVAPPAVQHGRSIAPLFENPAADHRDHTFITFNRFGIEHEGYGEFYPIRCVTDGRYKLAINLFDTDELYDLQEDPDELNNRIEDAGLADVRHALHDAILEEMRRTQDPLRSAAWSARPWSTGRSWYFHGRDA